MLNIKFRSSIKRTEEGVSPETTIKAALEMQEMDYVNSLITLDGQELDARQLNQTFAELGIRESAILSSTTRKESAHI